MDVVFAKSLNSTFGSGKFKGFDELMTELFQKIENAMVENHQKQIEAESYPVALTSNTQKKYDFIEIKTHTQGETFSMHCPGTAHLSVNYIPQGVYDAVFDVYKNGNLIAEDVSSTKITFNENDEFSIVGKARDSYGYSSQVKFYVAIVAEESVEDLVKELIVLRPTL